MIMKWTDYQTEVEYKMALAAKAELAIRSGLKEVDGMEPRSAARDVYVAIVEDCKYALSSSLPPKARKYFDWKRQYAAEKARHLDCPPQPG
jgi:hypothetical protein